MLENKDHHFMQEALAEAKKPLPLEKYQSARLLYIKMKLLHVHIIYVKQPKMH